MFSWSSLDAEFKLERILPGLQNTMSVPSGCHVSVEKSTQNIIVASLRNHVFCSLTASSIFLLSLIFSNLSIMCKSVGFFVFLLLRFVIFPKSTWYILSILEILRQQLFKHFFYPILFSPFLDLYLHEMLRFRAFWLQNSIWWSFYWSLEQNILSLSFFLWENK